MKLLSLILTLIIGIIIGIAYSEKTNQPIITGDRVINHGIVDNDYINTGDTVYVSGASSTSPLVKKSKCRTHEEYHIYGTALNNGKRGDKIKILIKQEGYRH